MTRVSKPRKPEKKRPRPSSKALHNASKRRSRLLPIALIGMAGIVLTAVVLAGVVWSFLRPDNPSPGQAELPAAAEGSLVGPATPRTQPTSLFEPTVPPPESAALPPEPPTPAPQSRTRSDGPTVSPSDVSPPLSEFTYLPPTTVEGLKAEEIEAAEQLVNDFADRPGPLDVLATVHEKHGDTEAAVECWQRCVALAPDSPQAYHALGRIALRKAAYQEAIDFWRKALENAPAMPRLHHQIACALTCLGKTEEAIEALKKDLEITPRAFRSHFLLGQAYLQLKQYKQAKTSYQAAIQLRGEYMNAYYGLATACARLGEREQAKQYREKFKELQARDLQNLKRQNKSFDDLLATRRQVAATYSEIGPYYARNGDLQKAERLWRKAAALDPTNGDCRLQLVELYWKSHRNAEALQVCEQLRKLDPKNALLCMRMSMLHVRLQQYDAAERALREVIALAPEQATGYDSLAQLYLHLNKRLPEAKALAQKAVELEPSALNYFTFSQACERTGDRAGALSALQRAIRLDPTNVSYQRSLQAFASEEMR